jgi:hypothetical protein
MMRRLGSLLWVMALSGTWAAPLAGQNRVDSVRATGPFPPNSDAKPVAFGPGERLVYEVKVGIFSVGEGSMSLLGIDSVRGRATYVGNLAIQGSLGPAKVRDDFRSWFDVQSLQSWRFIQDIHDLGYKSYRHYEMYPAERKWDREDNDEFGPLGSTMPLDDVAFIYYVRTLPLRVGRTYTLNRYFKEEGNPVAVTVLRRDERETEAGTFKTIVVKPTIKTDGLFGEGGDAELHFTDDDRRILVYLKSNIPKFPGSLTLHLKEIREGLPLHPEARARALAKRGDPPPQPGRPFGS